MACRTFSFCSGTHVLQGWDVVSLTYWLAEAEGPTTAGGEELHEYCSEDLLEYSIVNDAGSTGGPSWRF